MNQLNLLDIILNLIFLVIIDLIWFQVSLKKVYKPVLGKINGGKMYFHYPTAILSWLFISILINGFANSVSDAFSLGFLTYGIYNLTNYATIKNYNYTYLIVDTIWGGVVSALSYMATQKALEYF